MISPRVAKRSVGNDKLERPEPAKLATEEETFEGLLGRHGIDFTEAHPVAADLPPLHRSFSTAPHVRFAARGVITLSDCFEPRSG